MKEEYYRDSFAGVNLMHHAPLEKFSKLKIPLCHILAMPEVRPTLKSDVDWLMHEF